MELNLFKKIQSKSAQSFPIQIVLMVILGVVLLGMGLGLFGRIFLGGEDFTQDLSSSLKNNIDANYCQGEKTLCAPNIVLRGKDSDISALNVVNLESTTKTYRLAINFPITPNQIDASCGVLDVQAYNLDFTIESGKAAQIPIAFSKVNVNSRPCSFTTTAYLTEAGSEVPNSRIPLIIRVE